MGFRIDGDYLVMDHIYPTKPECFNGGHAAKNACNWQMKAKYLQTQSIELLVYYAN
jgi:hypothetical protein